MAKRHSTPPNQRPIGVLTPSKSRDFVQRIAWDAIEIDECLRDILSQIEKLHQATKASRRLGNQIYRQIREKEKGRERNK